MLQSKGITVGRISWIWWELRHRLRQDRYALRFLIPTDILIHRNQQKQQLPAPTMSSIEKKKGWRIIRNITSLTFGSLVVNTMCFPSGEGGFNPGWGTKIPHVTWCSQKKFF